MKPQAHIISIAAFLASVHALDRAACPGGSATCRYRDTVEVTEEPYKIALLNCCENDPKMTQKLHKKNRKITPKMTSNDHV